MSDAERLSIMASNFAKLSFLELVELRRETLKSHRELPDRSNTEFVKDIDAELRRRNRSIGSKQAGGDAC